MPLHPTIGQMDMLICGELDSQAAGLLRDHLSACGECKDSFDQCQANQAMAEPLRDALKGWGLRAGAHKTTVAHADTSASPTDQTYPGYEIIREIRQGGQGVVYEAIQLSTRRRVALKVLLGGEFARNSSKRRFAREIELAANLNHPNVIVIYDSGIAQGNPYFAMEHIDGVPINRYVQEHRPSLREIVALVVQVCDAVSHAHQHRVIHRDLKPSNILVAKEGTPHLLDFGLARTTDRTEEAGAITHVSITGQVFGTLRYMSPEQTKGDSNQIDIRTDIYSVAVVAYELLTGSVPYDTSGDLETSLRNIRETMPPRPSSLSREIPSEIEAILLNAMEKEPDHRYQSASQMRDDFEAWLDARPISVRVPSSLYLLRKLVSRHKVTTAMLGSLLVILFSFASISFELYRRTRASIAERDVASNATVTARQTLSMHSLESFEDSANMTMEHFFRVWQVGDLAEARRVQSRMRPSLPNTIASSFMLEGKTDLQELRSQLPPEAVALADIVHAERLIHAGRHAEAAAALEKAGQMQGAERFRRLAEARLIEVYKTIELRTADSATDVQNHTPN